MLMLLNSSVNTTLETGMALLLAEDINHIPDAPQSKGYSTNCTQLLAGEKYQGDDLADNEPLCVSCVVVFVACIILLLVLSAAVLVAKWLLPTSGRRRGAS